MEGWSASLTPSVNSEIDLREVVLITYSTFDSTREVYLVDMLR